MARSSFSNPFRAGAGHSPPYLAGRESEKQAFRRLLQQTAITDNPIITGLRGVGKTVLLDELKQIAIGEGWLWVGTDMSESASLTEQTLAARLLADLSIVTSEIVVASEPTGMGFPPSIEQRSLTLDYESLFYVYERTPGLATDKLKAVLELVAQHLPNEKRGIIFAYDEAQNLADHAADNQFPLSLMLDLFQSLQRKNLRIMLTLVGLPTLLPKLVEARTSAERMFHVITLERLHENDCRDAIRKPISAVDCPVKLSDTLIDQIVVESGGYPYFIQFICREVYDIAIQKNQLGEDLIVSMPDITRKLDADFFAGRWSRATDRQRDLMRVVAQVESCDTEFTVQQVVEMAKQLHRDRRIPAAFSPSHVNQMLSKLSAAGLVYKNRHGRYAFAVPLLSQFIRRQAWE